MLSCQEHIEEVIDRYLDDYEELPIIELFTTEMTCEFCTEKAIYQITQTIKVEEF